jgi:hypothetical protein
LPCWSRASGLEVSSLTVQVISGVVVLASEISAHGKAVAALEKAAAAAIPSAADCARIAPSAESLTGSTSLLI